MEASGAPHLRVGCAIWAHKPWIGTFFDATVRPDSLLSEYARRFSTVEGNPTFYAVPDDRTVRRWRDSVPEDFRFVFKMPRRVTHELRLRDCTEEVRFFLDRLGPLHPVMGPIFIQLPPSFGPRDLDVLRTFVKHLPTDVRWAVEVRHRDFFVDGPAERPLDELLREVGFDRVIMDSRAVHAGPSVTAQERDEIRSKPLLPVRPVATSGSPIVRFIGQTAIEPNVGFWHPWVDVYCRWLEQGLEPYFFVHTPDNVASPHLAARLSAEIAARFTARTAAAPEPGPAPPNSHA